MTPYVTEILEEISKSPDMLLTRHKDNFAIKTLCQYAFDKSLKLELPEGEPPFKPDAAPLGMSPANFYQQVKKLYIFTRKDLSNVRREQLFIQLLEGLHPSEAKVCIAIKDQNLTSLYPGITADLVVKAGFVSEANVFRESVVQGTKEPKGKQLVVNLSDGATAKESFGKPAEKPVEEPKPEVQAAPKKRGRPKKA
jgi:hypothetical protein